MPKGRIARPLSDYYSIKDAGFKTPCWIWTGAVSSSGYGRLRRDRKDWSAHRYLFKMYKGLVPDGFELDHLCKNLLCVNPEHLEIVTHAENIKRWHDAKFEKFRGQLATHASCVGRATKFRVS